MKTKSTFICKECNAPFTKKHSDLEFDNPVIGKFTVKGVVHYACELCNDILIIPDESNRIELEELSLCIKYILKISGPQPSISLKNYLVKTTNCKLDNINKTINLLEKYNKITVERFGKIEVLTLIKEKEKPGRIKSILLKIWGY